MTCVVCVRLYPGDTLKTLYISLETIKKAPQASCYLYITKIMSLYFIHVSLPSSIEHKVAIN